MNRDMEELVSKRHEDELAVVTIPTSSVTGQNIEQDRLLIPLKVNLKVGLDFEIPKFFS